MRRRPPLSLMGSIEPRICAMRACRKTDAGGYVPAGLS